MNHVINKFCPRIDFDSYEDFYANFQIDVPDNFNFGFDVVDEWARVEPDKRALLWANDDGEEKALTFTDISRLSDSVAAGFARLGIGKGDVVMVMLRQRWEYWVTAVALCKLGAIITPATVQLTAKDITYRLTASGARALVVLDDAYAVAQAEQALPQCPDIIAAIKVITEEQNESPAPGSAAEWTNFSTLLNTPAESFVRPQGAAATINSDIMIIYFTSGTTGLAKMAMHNFAHPLGHILTARYWQQVQEDQLHCSVSDSGWAKFGWGKIYGQWICGATIFAYDARRFGARELLGCIQKYRIKTFCVPPTMYRFMLQEDVAAFDLSSVQTFTTAGEPLEAEVSRRWLDLTGKDIRQGFGQSEGPVLIATFPWLEPKLGSMGKPSPLLNIRLLDDNGLDVADGEEGMICVTGLREHYPPGLFVGYYRDEERTREAVGGELYNLHDLAWRDTHGYFTFIGRDDDVIKSSGYRIGPFEVESALAEHPAVLECAVTAAPDELRGTVVKATIVLKPGFIPTDELARELQNHVKQTTAPYKYPRIVEFTEELPKTIGGKIKRAQIRTEDEGGTWDG